MAASGAVFQHPAKAVTRSGRMPITPATRLTTWLKSTPPAFSSYCSSSASSADLSTLSTKSPRRNTLFLSPAPIPGDDSENSSGQSRIEKSSGLRFADNHMVQCPGASILALRDRINRW